MSKKLELDIHKVHTYHTSDSSFTSYHPETNFGTEDTNYYSTPSTKHRGDKKG